MAASQPTPQVSTLPNDRAFLVALYGVGPDGLVGLPI